MTVYGRIARVGMVLGLAVAAAGLTGCEALMPHKEITPTKAISTLSAPAGEAGEPAEGHFVTKWLMLGPFTFGEDDFGGDQQQPSADEAFMPKEARLDGTQEPPEGASWAENQFTGTAGRPGQVDLDALYKRIDHAAAYAVCWLECPRALPDAKLLTGSDDYLTVWINGKLVHAYKKERRAGEADQDTIENVALKKGYNRIVVKCVDVVRGWNFFLRLTDKDGKPLLVQAP